MTPFEQLENSRLTHLIFKLLATLRDRTTRSEFFVAESCLRRLSDDHQSRAVRADDTRTRDAIRHSEIILRVTPSDFDRDGGAAKTQLYRTLGNFLAVRTLGGERNDILRSSVTERAKTCQ